MPFVAKVVQVVVGTSSSTCLFQEKTLKASNFSDDKRQKFEREKLTKRVNRSSIFPGLYYIRLLQQCPVVYERTCIAYLPIYACRWWPCVEWSVYATVYSSLSVTWSIQIPDVPCSSWSEPEIETNREGKEWHETCLVHAGVVEWSGDIIAMFGSKQVNYLPRLTS